MVQNVTWIKSGIMVNVNVSVKIWKSIMCVKKFIFWNPALETICQNGKYLGSVTDNSVITCDEIMEEWKTFQKNYNKKKVNSKTKKFSVLLIFLLITVALLTAFSIYCYLIKYQVKQKRLLPSLGKKCPYSKLFWPVFSRIWTEYFVSLRIEFECEKMRTTVTRNSDTFHAVISRHI